MSGKRMRNRPTSPPPPATNKLGRRHTRAILAAVAIVALAGVGWWVAHSGATRPPSAEAHAAQPANPPAPAAAAAPSDFMKLKGQWRRPDGGYVIDVRSVDDHGAMDAGYFNPRPIHVARAAASREGAETKVFIELRDVNYPGSTYNLAYDPQSDRLTGIYFQAALGQSYEVVFMRAR